MTQWGFHSTRDSDFGDRNVIVDCLLEHMQLAFVGLLVARIVRAKRIPLAEAVGGLQAVTTIECVVLGFLAGRE